MSNKQFFWAARQLKGRLRDDAHQLSQLVTSSDLNILLLPDLWRLVIDYWSEDGRIVDLLNVNREWHASSEIFDAYDHQRIKIYADITWVHEITTVDVDLTRRHSYIRLGVIQSCGYRPTRWFIDTFAALFVLPEVDEDGREVPTEYPPWINLGIMALRNVLYNALT